MISSKEFRARMAIGAAKAEERRRVREEIAYAPQVGGIPCPDHDIREMAMRFMVLAKRLTMRIGAK